MSRANPNFFRLREVSLPTFASLKASSLGEGNPAPEAIESRAGIPGLFVMKVVDGYLKVGFYFLKEGEHI
jgi:hypothetical protein